MFRLRRVPAPAALARVTASLVLAEAAVHEVRYAAAGAVGPHSHGAHLSAVTGPLVGVLCAALLAHVLLRAAVAPQQAAAKGARLRVLWPLATLAVLALFLSQEAVEAALSYHHQGLGGTIAGGWAALPASVLAGGLLTLAVRVTSAVASAPRPGSALLSTLRLQPLGPQRALWCLARERATGRRPDRLRSGRAPPSAATSPPATARP